MGLTYTIVKYFENFIIIKICKFTSVQSAKQTNNFLKDVERRDWLCWGLTTRQPMRVILCRLPEKGRKEIEERVEEIKERDREERGTGMKVKKVKKQKK